MIWQLMKRDWAWRGTPWAVILCALFALSAHGVWPHIALLFLAMVMWIDPGFISNCNLYEAALPIEARALWVSRIASRLAVLWLPVLAVTAVLAIRGDRLPYLLAGAGVWTVVILAVKRFRIREFSAPRWARFAAFAVVFAVLVVFPDLVSEGGPGLPPAGIVLAICGLASMALFLSGWFAVPKMFQSAPVRPRASAQRASRGPSRFLWSPVFRSIYRWQMGFMLFLLVSQLAIGSFTVAYIYVPAFLTVTPDPRRWLSAVPVASRTLFRLTFTPLAAAASAASVIRIFVDRKHPLTPRTRIVELAAELAILCLMFWLCELSFSSRLSKLKRWVRAMPMVAGLALLVIPGFAGKISHDRFFWTFDGALGVIAAALPENGWLLASAVAGPLVLFYWLAEKTFGEMEYATAVRPVELYR